MSTLRAGVRALDARGGTAIEWSERLFAIAAVVLQAQSATIAAQRAALADWSAIPRVAAELKAVAQCLEQLGQLRLHIRSKLDELRAIDQQVQRQSQAYVFQNSQAS